MKALGFWVIALTMIECAPRIQTTGGGTDSLSPLGQAYTPNTELYSILFSPGDETVFLSDIRFDPASPTAGTLTIGISSWDSIPPDARPELAVILGEMPVEGQPFMVATEKRYFSVDSSSSELRVSFSGNLILYGRAVWCYLFVPKPDFNFKGSSEQRIFCSRTGEVVSVIREQLLQDRDDVEAKRISNIVHSHIPCEPDTVIVFALPKRQHVRLEIYDVTGHLVRKLVDGPMEAGCKEMSWDGKDKDGNSVVGGVYFYRLNTGTQIMTKKMILSK